MAEIAARRNTHEEITSSQNSTFARLIMDNDKVVAVCVGFVVHGTREEHEFTESQFRDLVDVVDGLKWDMEQRHIWLAEENK